MQNNLSFIELKVGSKNIVQVDTALQTPQNEQITRQPSLVLMEEKSTQKIIIQSSHSSASEKDRQFSKMCSISKQKDRTQAKHGRIGRKQHSFSKSRSRSREKIKISKQQHANKKHIARKTIKKKSSNVENIQKFWVKKNDEFQQVAQTLEKYNKKFKVKKEEKLVTKETQKSQK